LKNRGANATAAAHIAVAAAKVFIAKAQEALAPLGKKESS
jgi:hypothetical protein